jgi:hypothetical protein
LASFHGRPLDTYVSELVSYQYGAEPYCMVDGSEQFLKQVECRLHRITAKLVTQVGQDLVTRAKTQAKMWFDEESSNVDFAACQEGNVAFDRRMLNSLKDAHLPMLKALEREAKIANKRSPA